MQRPVRAVGWWLLLVTAAHAADVDPAAALPKDVTYDTSLPTPEKYLGFRIGRRHVEHREAAGYLHALDQLSDRFVWHPYGHSYGDRELGVLVITSPENQKHWKQIQTTRKNWLTVPADPSTSQTPPNVPVVIYMGYSVHGNEASGTNAALLVAYALAAAEGDVVDQWLEQNVILLDPCLNPDGLERFTSWVNNHRGARPSLDPAAREHHEAWPGGRTNYYWFDLNRDWLPLQHPESQSRLNMLRAWRPNVVLDFHEMTTDSTFFFQPGVPNRRHPLISDENVKLTARFGEMHAQALDKVGSQYFTEEVFDDFYIGKGSTYADLHGGIGILFEQASARGHVQESKNGPLTFSYAIRNHVITSFSSLRAATEMHDTLLDYQRRFYSTSMEAARANRVKSYLFSAPHDPVRLYHFSQILAQHGIETRLLTASTTINEQPFAAGESIVVPVEQPEFQFLEALLERRTQFNDRAFYDTSAWTLPLAFDLQQATSEHDPSAFSTNPRMRFPRVDASLNEDAVAYAIDWRGYYAPKTLYRLLDQEVVVKVAQSPFHVSSGESKRELPRGTLLVPMGVQAEEKRAVIRRILRQTARRDGVEVTSVPSGLTPGGVDLGSNQFTPVRRPQILLVVGDGVRASEAGEVWHLLDRRFSIPVTLIDVSQLMAVDLTKYTTLVLVSGRYSSMGDTAITHVRQWLERGGVVIGISGGVQWLIDHKVGDFSLRPRGGADSSPRPYADAADALAAERISGAIFEAKVDSTHPLAYGLRETIPVFRDHRLALQVSSNPYATPLIYAREPLLSGYASEANIGMLAASASVVVAKVGKGRAIAIMDNPNFRAYWFGTNRLFMNAVFFGSIVRDGNEEENPPEH